MANALSTSSTIKPATTTVKNSNGLNPNGTASNPTTTAAANSSSTATNGLNRTNSAGVSYPTSEAATGGGGVNAMQTGSNGLSSTGGAGIYSTAAVTPVQEEDAVPEVAPNNVTSETADKTRAYLDLYNQNREQKIRDMYAGNLFAQNAQQQTAFDKNMAALQTAYDANLGNLKTAYDNNTASLKTAYDKNLAQIANSYQQNLSDANAYKEGISPRYQESMNALSAEYERQRRNNNMQAAVNGINTGTGSQLALGQAMAYQNTQGNLSRSENEALNEAERGINDLNRAYQNQQDIINTEYNNNVDKLNREYENQLATYGTTFQNNILDLKTNYENKIAEAAANNDYQLAAALLDEYGAQYDRAMQQASQLAEFGDFSMYANIYGVDAAQQMEKMWSFQNPDLAYNLGRITAEDYFNMTGNYPSGYSAAGGYGVRRNADGTVTYAGKTYGRSSGKAAEAMDDYDYNFDLIYKTAESAAQGANNRMRYRRSYNGRGRDRAYRGPAGYYTTDGNFYVPETGRFYGSSEGRSIDPADQAAADNLAKYNGWTGA